MKVGLLFVHDPLLLPLHFFKNSSSLEHKPGTFTTLQTNVHNRQRALEPRSPSMAPRMILINLPVIDVLDSTKFYESIGGSINPNFTTADCTCMVFSESIYVMIMTREMF